MLKYLLISFIVSAPGALLSQPGKANIGEIKVDDHFIIWYSFIIDSNYIDVRLSDGSLPRRENGSYLLWKADSTGEIIPIRKIETRTPGQSIDKPVAKPEEYFYDY